MNRARKSHKGLPKRVYVTDGAYRFKPIAKMADPKDGKLKTWITLCRVSDGESTMLLALSKLIDETSLSPESMPFLCREFSTNKLNKFSEEVQKQYRQFLSVIANDFEQFTVQQVTTKSCAEFLRNNFKGKANTAQKYAGLMRKVFKYAISELGLRQDNPIDQLDLGDYETKRREALPTHAQVKAIRDAGYIGLDGKKTSSGVMFACLIDMSYLCWQRAIEIRTLKEVQIMDGRIRFAPTKTMKTSGKIVDIAITPAIQDVINRAREIKKKYQVISPFLFPTLKGGAYTRSGLFSMWDRARSRAGITEDVIFKDLRALGATDAARSGENMADIQTRLAHTSSKTSEIYIKEAIPSASKLSSELPWK